MKNPILIGLLVVGLILVALGAYRLIAPPQPVSTATTALKEGSISVTQPWTSVGKFKGKIIVVMSGTATVDSTFPPATPDGIDKPAPSFFVVPNERIFSSLARYNGQVVKVGTYKELYLPSETELFLEINEDTDKKDGKGFDDNKGNWTYRILAQ